MSAINHTFDFESQSFQLRKTCGYELWVDGTNKFYFSDKSNAFNSLYENMLRISFGKYGYASVNSVLKVHQKADLEFHIFLQTIGEF